MLLEIIQSVDNPNNYELNFAWFITFIGTIGGMIVIYFVRNSYEKHNATHKEIDEHIDKLKAENTRFREDFIRIQNEVNALDSKSGANFRHIENKIDKNYELFMSKLDAKFETFESKLQSLREVLREYKESNHHEKK